MLEKDSTLPKQIQLQMGEVREKDLPTSPRFELVTMTWDPITDLEEGRKATPIQDLAYPIKPHEHIFVDTDTQLYRLYSFVQILAPTESTEKTIEVGVVGEKGKTEKRTYGVAAEELQDEPFVLHFDVNRERLSIRLNKMFTAAYGLNPLEIAAPHTSSAESIESINNILFSGGSLEVLPSDPSTQSNETFLRIRTQTTSGNIKEILIRQIEVEPDKAPIRTWDPMEGQIGTIATRESSDETLESAESAPPIESVQNVEIPPKKKEVVFDREEQLKRYQAREAEISRSKRTRLTDLRDRLGGLAETTRKKLVQQSNTWKERLEKRKKRSE